MRYRQSRFRTVGKIPLERLKDSWEEAKVGLQFAINFLRSNAGIEDESLLSSPLLVIPIAVLAVLRKGKLSEQDERDLLHWVFVANAFGHYSTSSETTLDADLNILFRGGDPAQLVDVVCQRFGRVRFQAADFAGRGSRNALFATAYLALRHAGAKDWRSGLRVSLTHSGRYHYIEAHHIFAKSVLAGAKVPADQINEIANFAFVSGGVNRAISNKTPDVYFPSIVHERGADALSAQQIPLSEDLWRLENFGGFLDWTLAV